MAGKKFSQFYTCGRAYTHTEEFNSIEDVINRFKNNLACVGVHDLVVTPIDETTWIFRWDNDSRGCIVTEVE